MTPSPPGKHTIYLAGRYGRRAELAHYAAHLTQAGHHITARWLSGAHDGPPVPDDGIRLPGSLADSQRFALEDVQDLQAADLVLVFTEPPGSPASRGGRHVELGMALAWEKAIVVIGGRENVFCCLPGVDVFATAADAFAAYELCPWTASLEATP